jgi:hypothetical protein
MRKPGLSRLIRRWFTKLGLSVAVALLVIVVTQDNILKLGVIRSLELRWIDYRFLFRGVNQSVKDSSNVVIVEISEESFKSSYET